METEHFSDKEYDIDTDDLLSKYEIIWRFKLKYHEYVEVSRNHYE